MFPSGKKITLSGGKNAETPVGAEA